MLQRPYHPTMSAAIAALQQNEQLNPVVPRLEDLLQQEAATAAWLKTHGVTDMTCDRPNHDDRLVVVEPSRPEPLALGTPVRVACLGITDGVISGRSTCDGSRYRVSFFDRRLWTVRHKWVTRGVIAVVPSKQTAARP